MSRSHRTRRRAARRTARTRTRDALEILDRDMGDDPDFHRMVEEEKLNAHVARLIYEARTRARLTQKQLAELTGATQPVIARLEEADHARCTLTMLARIAEALNRRVDIRFVAKRRAGS
jgi:ribosome-binding protein aMBF1 (putative translation factor)